MVERRPHRSQSPDGSALMCEMRLVPCFAQSMWEGIVVVPFGLIKSE
jgi:hypothetical protein